MLSTILFCLFCALGAGMVYLHRPGTRAGLVDPQLYWAVGLGVLVSAMLFVGDSNEYGQRLTLTTEELRIPLADAEADGTYFVVGPRAENSDLIVGPYADSTQSKEAYREELDGLLTIRREGSVWKACGRSVAADSAANLPGMRIQFDGVPVEGENCQPLSATPVNVLIERLDADRGHKRRHLTLSLAQDHVRIGLKPDEYLVTYLGRCPDLTDPSDSNSNARLRLAPAGLHGEDRGYRVPRNLVIDQLGQGGTNKFLAPMKLGPIANLSELCRTDNASVEQRLTWPDGGSATRLVITARTTAISWWIGLLVLLCTFVTVRLCKAGWRDGRGRTEAGLVIALQWLLALRLLIAMSGFTNDPALTLPDMLWPPAVGYVCVPIIAVALLRGHGEGIRRTMAGLALLVVIAGAFVWWSLDWLPPGWQERILGGITLALLALRARSHSPQPLLYDLVQKSARMAAAVGRWTKSVFGFLAGALPGASGRLLRDASTRAQQAGQWLGGSMRRTGPDGSADASVDLFQAGLLLAVGTFAVRFAIAAAGKILGPSDKAIWQERFDNIPFIDNLPLSLPYAPLAIIAMALMLVGYRKAPTLKGAFCLTAAFGLVFVAIAGFVHDLGLIFIFAWPVGLAIAKLAAVKPLDGGAKSWLARALLIGPLVSPILLVGGYYWMYAKDVPLPGDDLAGHMASSSAWDGNLARLQRYIGADALIDIGNTQALGALEQAAQLEPITEDLVGQGYMEPSGVVRPLLNYQYSDNLLAVLVTWPFGRIGLAALILSLLAVLISLRGRAGVSGRDNWMVQASNLAAMTIFWSGAYMALANLNLVPFTGRNFYLLAARSMGDLAEGLVLFLIVALPFAMLPQTAAAQDGEK